MPDLDLEPHEVRERYDVKPVSKWWLVLSAALVSLQAYINGFDKFTTWGLILFGMGLMATLILVFPRHFLRRRDD